LGGNNEDISYIYPNNPTSYELQREQLPIKLRRPQQEPHLQQRSRQVHSRQEQEEESPHRQGEIVRGEFRSQE
jgi:hypothetical protein